MEGFFTFMHKWGLHPAIVLVPVGILIAIGFLSFATTNDYIVGVTFSWIFFAAPLWLPVLLAVIAWPLWVRYKQRKFIASQRMILLEIRIPRDIMKSPRAMEAVFDGFAFGGGEATFINRNFEGRVRPWWSFELASFEGQIHFFIWTRAGLREIAETHIYAQFPEVEIYEIEDYATTLHFNPATMSVWGCDFKLTKKDAYPIKTYIDYELDKDPKEEYRIDPISHVFEALSTVGPGEQLWLQIIIRQEKSVRPKKLKKKRKVTKMVEGKPKESEEEYVVESFFETEARWRAEANEEIADIRKKNGGPTGTAILTKGVLDQIAAIERSLGKNPFDVGIRGLYIADKTAFKAVRINTLTGMFRHFSSNNLNGLAPTGWFTKYNWPWQGLFGSKEKMALEIVDAYKRRSWFFNPHKSDVNYVMTSEELATIYHFPSRMIAAPGLARVPAKKAGAPANLPF